MTVAFRSSQRHEIDHENWIAVSIRRPVGSKQGDDGTDADPTEYETVEGHIVDLSTTGIKIRSNCSFSFHERLILEVQRLESEESIFVTAEVRWTQPDQNMEETWSTGCIIADEIPTDYINDMARLGILDRRETKREPVREKAKSRVESIASDHNIIISDVSATGIGFLSATPVEAGKRVQIEIRDEENNGILQRFTVRAMRTKEVEGGFFVGCKLLQGSTYKILGQAVAANVREATTYRKVVPALNLLCMVLLIALIIKDALNLF